MPMDPTFKRDCFVSSARCFDMEATFVIGCKAAAQRAAAFELATISIVPAHVPNKSLPPWRRQEMPAQRENREQLEDCGVVAWGGLEKPVDAPDRSNAPFVASSAK